MKDRIAPAIPYSEAMDEFYRTNPEIALEVLNEAIRDGDQEMFLTILGHIIRGWGSVAALADKTELNENTLYRTLSNKGNPTLKTLLNIFKVLGLTFSVNAKKETTI